MKAISLFAGAGGFEVGFDKAGIETVLQAESDAICLSVLAHHWPKTERANDVRSVGADVAADLVYGGWPCQGNSVAGKRGGLSDERSGLWHEVRRVLRELRPRWFVGENVPGLLSVCSCAVCQLVAAWADQHNQQRAAEGRTGSCRCAECLQGKRLRATHKGRDFGHVLADLDELGYGVAWRTLDARWFGVPQRRRRVFIVGCLGDARRAAQVLAFCEGCGGYSAPRREARERVAGSIGTRIGRSGSPERHDVTLVSTLDASYGRLQGASNQDLGHGHSHLIASTLTSGSHPGSNMPSRHKEGDENLVVASTVSASAGHHGHSSARGDGGDNLIAFDWQTQGSERTRPHTSGEYVSSLQAGKQDAIAQTLDASYAKTTASGGSHGSQAPVNVVHGDMGVRRLTPVEAERLQGFPDDWTRWGADGKEIADSHRYRLMGNAVATVCAQWLGYRLVEVDRQMRAEEGSHP